MDVAAIERHLQDHPADRDAWLVYADALLERDQRELAAAIHEALRGGREARIPAPDGAEVAWRMGLWRAARVSHRPALAAVLAHPAARFLERLILPLHAVDPAALAAAPALRAVEVLEGDAARDGLGALGPVVERLREVRWAGRIRAAPAAPALVRLAADRVPDWAGAVVPSLARLELQSPEDADLRALARADLPALVHLCLYRRSVGHGPVSAAAVDELLRAPVGRRLRRAELPLLPAAAARAHLEELVVDDAAEGGTVVPEGVRLRAVQFGGGTDFVRLAPPSTGLEQDLAFREATDDVGAAIAPAWEGSDGAWIEVPPGWARILAVRMAVVAGQPAQQLAVHTTTAPVRGRVREVSLSGTAWERGPDGAEVPIRLDETGEVTALAHGEDDDQYEVLRELQYQLIPEVSSPALVVPVSWRPDPFRVAPPGAGPAPRRLRPRGEDGTDLDPDLGRYVRWRAQWVGGLAPVPAPDLGRWTERLLRRHGLEAPPGDETHPYWVEWFSRTRPERARPAPDRDRVAAFKLAAPGRWVLAPEEAATLARWLRQRIERHRSPFELGPVLAVLEGGGEVEIEVG